MRGSIACLILGVAATSALAQDTAVFTDDDAWKLYTTPHVKFMEINGNNATIGGVGIGTVLNERWTFGAAGRLLINDIKADEDGNVNLDSWDLWDAGAEVGYIFAPASLVHLNPSLYFGGGQAQLDYAFDGQETASFIVLEPQIAVCLNLHETWELGVAVGYRWVSGVDTPALSDEDLSDLTGTIFVRATEF
jgi:hypothetical protein